MNELRSMSYTTPEEAKDWIGSRVDDIHGKQIGRLADIWEDPTTKEPTWLLVRFGGGADNCTLIPLREASRAKRRVWVPFDREFVRRVPWVHRHMSLNAKTNAAFARHYGLSAPEPSPPRRARRFAPPANRTAVRTGPAPAAVSALSALR